MKRSVPVLLVVLMLLATACQNGAPVRAVQTQMEAQPGVITLRLGYIPGEVANQVIDQVIAAFEKQNPRYRIEKVEMPPYGPDQRKLMDERAKAGEYDIIPHPATSIDQSNLIVMDPYLSRAGADMARAAAVSDSMRIDGRLYQVPFLLMPRSLVINRDLWEAAGLPLPGAEWSWDQFREAAARLTKGEGAGKVWGFNTDLHEHLVAVYLMEKTGPSFWRAEEEDLRAALRFFTSMVQLDHSLPVPPGRDWGRLPVNNTGSRLFEQKQAALEYRPFFPIAEMNRVFRFAWDVAPMPAGPGQKPIMRVSPRAFAITKGSSQTEAAWEFIRFAAGPEGARVVAAAGAIPADGAAVTPEVWSSMQPAPPPGTVHLLSTPWVTDVIIDGNAGRMAQELYRLTNLSLRGELDPDVAVSQFVEFRKQWIVD